MRSLVNPNNNSESSQENGDNPAEDTEFDDEFREDEMLKLLAEMDAINIALDNIEKKNDEINKHIKDFLKETRESRKKEEEEVPKPEEANSVDKN
ncbi:hypothetical protein Anas_02858 [Armadillidium nasatum]|uniref:Uncharacterized protein n=1 Tax=Armadillidium nasatum TaxID=96803 RepID=A0A5N5SU33_9CRUS|nr:hypothetical protein Anas_02858 [Armadillidium nasatum]